MGRSNFTGAPASTAPFWRIVRNFKISFEELHQQPTGEQGLASLEGEDLLRALETMDSNCNHTLEALNEAMTELRLDVKKYVELYRMPFWLGVMGKGKPQGRPLCIQWRMRVSGGDARSTRSLIAMNDWPEVLKNANEADWVKQWYAQITSILVILNTQSSIAHSTRIVLRKNIENLRALIETGMVKPTGQSSKSTES